MTTCYVAGIVKGLVEHNDPRRYFGSLAAFREHAAEAQRLGLTEERGLLTPLGLLYYTEQQLSKLPEQRSYMWPNQNWSAIPVKTK